jgi:hypothetical protein
MRASRDVGPNQLALWPRHELTDVFRAERRPRSTRKVVPLACPFWRSTKVNSGDSAHRCPPCTQVREVAGQKQDQRPIFPSR